MQRTHKLLVGLDSSEMDATLANFISFISYNTPVKQIYFLNVIKSAEDVYLSDKEIKTIDDGLIESQRKKLWETVNNVVEEHDEIDFEVIVKTGSRLREFLKFIKKEEIDSVITGFKKKSKGSGILNQRLARRAPCNVIIIPEGHKPNIKKLLVPIDFSKYSKMAFEYAAYISRNYDRKIEIICQNVYSVPSGYHYSGKSVGEFAKIMEDNAKKAYKSWVSRLDFDIKDIPITTIYTLDEHDDFGGTIRKVANEHNVSGILLGAKGRSSSSSIFIGSTAEKLVNKIDYLPLTIVRPKGQIAGLIESLGDL